MEEIIAFAQAVGLPAGVVAGLMVVGYVLKVVHKAAQTLSVNPGLSSHLSSIEDALKGILAQQQDGVQMHSEMAQSLRDISQNIAVIKDRGERR